MNKYRSHNCNELRSENVGRDVILSGWINKKRDHGNLLFIDLRDNYGITQCIIDKENSNFKELEKIQLETVIKIEGRVVNRSKETINKEIKCIETKISKFLRISDISSFRLYFLLILIVENLHFLLYIFANDKAAAI